MPSFCGRQRKGQLLARFAARPGSARRPLQLAQEVRRLDAVGDELRQLEEENGKLKKIVAELSLDKAMLQDVIRRKF